MKLVIFGATGGTGQQVMEQALARGHEVTAVARSPKDVTLWADGGGKAPGAITEPLHGRDAVARFLVASPRIPKQPYQPTIQTVNGEPAVVLQADGQPRLVLFVSMDQDQISAIHAIGNPDKLHWVSKSPSKTKE